MGWYEHELGWPTAGTRPVSLVTGVRFDVLEVPAAAGFAVLNRFPRPGALGPVAFDRDGPARPVEPGDDPSADRPDRAPRTRGRGTVRLLVAAGAAEQLPGLLDWLEWGGIPLDLSALGQGGLMRAPAHPEWERRESPGRGGGDSRLDRGAPVWLRPPPPGDVEPALPAMDLTSGPGGSEEEPVGLVAVVSALAAICHRVRLLETQPCSFSYASRMVAGTRPRSLTS